MKPVSSYGCEGFSLAEGIGGLLLFSLMMGALTYGMGSLFKFQSHPDVSYRDQIYTEAPSFGDFRQAVSLHAAFAGAVDQSDNIILLGGARSHPVSDPNGPASVLQESFAASSLTAAPGSDPFRAYSSWDQVKQINPTQFGSYLTTAQSDPADFTILTVQGLSHITSITQQRRYTSTINGENVVLYEVTHQSIDWSSGVPVLTPTVLTEPDGTAYPVGTPTYFYRIYYDLAEDTWAQAPGVTHFWYRTDAAWDRDQEAPARVVFADPYVLAGQDTHAQVTAVSRFVYFLPQSR